MTAMQITVKIDNRENKLKDDLKQSIESTLANTRVTFDNLYCGDFIIEIDEKPIVVIERKTLSDLVASIKDGRYRVQKGKLCQAFEKTKVMYLIEGEFNYSLANPTMIDGMDKYSIVSSIVNTQFRDGLKLVHTKGLQDTHDFILAIVTRFSKDPSKYCDAHKLTDPQTSDSTLPLACSKGDFISKNKVSNKEDLYYFQLSQVPGISGKTAQAFVDRFSNMKQFYEMMSPLDDEQKLKILKNIMIEDGNKKRRISSKVAENVLKYMF